MLLIYSQGFHWSGASKGSVFSKQSYTHVDTNPPGEYISMYVFEIINADEMKYISVWFLIKITD